MHVSFDWPTDVVVRLTEEARGSGLTLEAYLLKLARVNPVTGESADAEAGRVRRQAALDQILTLRARNILGPDLTIRDLIEDGRRG